MASRSEVTVKDVRHSRVCGGQGLYCAHPRQGGLFNFGDGELVLIHPHATWPYERERPNHGFGSGYKSRCVWLLQRSTDGGMTWPECDNVIVYDEKSVSVLFTHSITINPIRKATTQRS